MTESQAQVRPERTGRYTPEQHFETRLPLMRWAMAMGNAALDLSPAAHCCAWILLTFGRMDLAKDIETGTQFIVEATGMERRSVIRALTELRESGVIDRAGGGGSTSARTKLLPPDQCPRRSPVTETVTTDRDGHGGSDRDGHWGSDRDGHPKTVKTVEDGSARGRARPRKAGKATSAETAATITAQRVIDEEWDRTHSAPAACPAGCGKADLRCCREHGRGYPWDGPAHRAAAQLGAEYSPERLRLLLRHFWSSRHGQFKSTLAWFVHERATIEAEVRPSAVRSGGRSGSLVSMKTPDRALVKRLNAEMLRRGLTESAKVDESTGLVVIDGGREARPVQADVAHGYLEAIGRGHTGGFEAYSNRSEEETNGSANS